jgi:hypothetical protein
MANIKSYAVLAINLELGEPLQPAPDKSTPSSSKNASQDTVEVLRVGNLPVELMGFITTRPDSSIS